MISFTFSEAFSGGSRPAAVNRIVTPDLLSSFSKYKLNMACHKYFAAKLPVEPKRTTLTTGLCSAKSSVCDVTTLETSNSNSSVATPIFKRVLFMTQLYTMRCNNNQELTAQCT
eukprot:m.21246 g.21246  ORF g.21246 m.21246 type:complete len:114 (-) comp7091_c0_seq1:54-395(-)